MLRKLALSMAVAGAIASSQANALGLGDIRIKSALNEPLNAEIQLSQVRDLNPLQIRPRMAGQDEFALAGISQQRALNGVRFQVKVNPNGTGVIELTSQAPVKEPFLNFLVEVNWPSGRLVREYTVLLDPPVFDPSPTQRPVVPAAVPSRQPVMPQVQVQPARQSVKPSSSIVKPKASANTSNIKTRTRSQTEAYVDAKDTLWGLAIEHRAAPDVSSYQMMVALFKKNPEAFPDNNINNLKAGMVLQLPSEAEARSITSKEAAAEVRRQTHAWKNRAKPAAPAPIDGSKPNLKSEAADSKEVEAAPEGQLKVITPTDASKEDAAKNSQNPNTENDATQKLQARNEELEEKLAVSLESIDRLERDNSDLNSKLDAIQQQLDSLQRLLELKNDSFAEIEAKLLEKQAAEAADNVVNNQSFLDKLLATPAYLAGIGAGVVAVLVGLFLLLRRKRKSEDAEEEGALIPPVALDTSDDMSDEELISALAEETDEESIEVEAGSESIDLDDISSLDELESLDDLDDLDDLDLDMDLNLDESFDNDLDSLSEDGLREELDESSIEKDEADLDELDAILDADTATNEYAEVDDEEFDLGLDDEFEGLDVDLSDVDSAPDALEDEVPELDPLDDSLDAMLGEDLDDDETELDIADDSALDELISLDLDDDDAEHDAARQRNERSGMGMVDSVEEDDATDDTLESLGLTALADKPFEATAELEESDDLDFDIDDLSDSSLEDEMSKLEAELDGLDFALDDEPADVVTPDSVSEAEENELEALESLDLDDEEAALADLDALLDEDSDEIKTSEVERAATIDEADLMADLDSMLDGEDDLDPEPVSEERAGLSGETLESLSDDLDDLDLDSLLSEEEMQLDDADDNALGLSGLDEEDSDQTLEELLDLEIEESVGDEADVDLAGLELDDELPKTPSDDEVTEELTSNIEHDLDAELDDELDALLNSTDNDIALEETSSAEEEPEEDPFDALGLLDGADEVETKLDLARAYIDMGDVEGAKDILDEITDEGSEAQVSEAKQLLEGLA